MIIDTNRFILSRVGDQGRKLHIFSCGWPANCLCGAGPSQEKVQEYSLENLCKICVKMYPEISRSAIAQIFLGF